MMILLNGQKKEVPDGLTVLGLLQLLAIQPERVAIELNLDIVRKNAFGSTPVNDGDAVEVVSFMGGGNSECGMRSAECGIKEKRRE
jgi:thiamine biosynthesis protein ThiS